MSVAPPPATYTATNDLNALKNIFVPQYQFSNGYYHAIVNTQLPGNVAVGNTTTGFLLTVNGAPTMTLSDLQNWSYYRATSNLVMNSNSITTVSKLTFVGGNTTNAFTIDAPNGFINVSAYYLRGNFINLSGGIPAWASYPASTNVNMVGYSISAAAFISLSLGGRITNPASNVIGFSNAAFGETMRITQSGQLSVGTSAQFPGFSLVVNGSSQFKSSIIMTTSGYTSGSNSFFVNTVPTSAGVEDVQLGALGGSTNMYFCTGGVLTQRLKLESNGNFTVMTGTLRTGDATLSHSIGGITFSSQNISAGSLTINGVPYNGGVAAGVASINSLCGVVTFTAGTNISLYTSGNSVVIGVSGSTGGSSGVTTLNTLSGAVTLTPGTNISLYRTGNSIVIGVSGGSSGGVTTLNTLSGALTLVAGTNISLFTSGSNITIRTNVSGIYGGVLLTESNIAAEGITTSFSGGYSSIGGVLFPGYGYLTASAAFTDSNQQSIIGGVTLEGGVVTVSDVSIRGLITMCGLVGSSIVNTVNGYGGGISIGADKGIEVVTSVGIGLDGNTSVSIATAPTTVTVITLGGASVTLPNNGRGDIFLFPTTFSPTGSTQVDFPPTPVGIAAGTSWRITNATNNTIDFTYNIALATLPNIDSLGLGTFSISPGISILLVKIEQATNTYYNVN